MRLTIWLTTGLSVSMTDHHLYKRSFEFFRDHQLSALGKSSFS